MNAFYSKISEFRKKCIETLSPSSFYFKSSRLYTVFMTALVELTPQDLREASDFEQNIPEDSEELFHYLWFLNARARYECFITHNYCEGLSYTNSIAELSPRLFGKDFEVDNLEKRSLIFILALNYIRLAFYRKDYDHCANQLKSLKDFFQHSSGFNWDQFPEALRLVLKNHANELLRQMNQEQKDYFLQKMIKVEEKLKQQV